MKVYSQGCFDLFHAGHVSFLERCSRLGEVTIALLSDEAIIKYRGKPPIMSFDDRKDVLDACKYVDSVIRSDPEYTLEESFGFDVMAIGTDWVTKDLYKQYRMDKDILDLYLIYIPYTENISSTIIKERIHEQKSDTT